MTFDPRVIVWVLLCGGLRRLFVELAALLETASIHFEEHERVLL
jgi:hypothetical protein